VQPRTSAEEWQKRVERWRDSGLPADQFAAELGINAGTLRFWGYKLNKAKLEGGAGVAPPKKKRSVRVPSFVEVRTTTSAAAFEIELGNGRRLRVPTEFDVDALGRLLSVLERK
jgi:hypothetical protein